MSADTPTRPPQRDASAGTADQVKPAKPADAGRQHGDARPRQPPDAGLRQDHADAMLTHPPGHAREAPTRDTPVGGDSRQAGQAQPERSTAPKAETGQRNGHRPETLLRQDHADAMLASLPGRTRDGKAGETAPATGKPPSSRDSHNGRPASTAAGDSTPHANNRHDAAARPGETASSRAPGNGDTWPPPQADRDSARALYAEDFGSKHATADRDRGTNIVGDKPARSPGDTSDLPPTGAELVETAGEDKPRVERVRNLLGREFGDVDDAANNTGDSVQRILEQPPPTGHPAVITDTHAHWTAESAPDATPSIGGIAEVALVLGVVTDRAIQWGRHKVADKTGRG
jgi:hypothetical protein